METSIKIPFGLAEWKNFKVQYAESGKKLKLDTYLLNKFVVALQAREYSEDKIGRIIFEEAIDHLMSIVALGIIEKIKIHKVPVSLTIPISRGSEFYNE